MLTLALIPINVNAPKTYLCKNIYKILSIALILKPTYKLK
jgi:hypothetical protein